MDDFIRNSSDREIYTEDPHLYEQLYKLLSSMRADFSINTLYQLLDKPVAIKNVQYMLDGVSWAESSEYHIYHFKESAITNDSEMIDEIDVEDGSDPEVNVIPERDDESEEENEQQGLLKESDDFNGSVGSSTLETEGHDVETEENNCNDYVHEEFDAAKELDSLNEQRKDYCSVLDDKRSGWKEEYSKLQDEIYDSTLYIEKLQKEINKCFVEIKQLSFLDFNKKKRLNGVIIGLNREISNERVNRDNLIERRDEEDKKKQAEITDIEAQIEEIDLEINRIKDNIASDRGVDSDELVKIPTDSDESVKSEEEEESKNQEIAPKEIIVSDEEDKPSDSEVLTDNQEANDESAADGLSIDVLELSTRPYNCLIRAGVKTIGQLRLLSDDELMRFRNMGRNSLTEIHEKLDSLLESESYVIQEDDAVQKTEITVEDVLVNDNYKPDDITIDSLGLSSRPYNCLHKAGVTTLGELIKMTDAQLISIEHMGKNSVLEIHRAMIKVIGKLHDEEFLKRYEKREEYAARLYNGTIIHDVPIEELGLSNRAYNCLTRQGIKNITELFNYTKDDLLNINSMGKKSAEEIVEVVHQVTNELAGEPEIDYESIQNADGSIDDDTKQKYYNSEIFYQFFANKINQYLSCDINNELSFENIKEMFSPDIDNMILIDNLKKMILDGLIINDEGIYRKKLSYVMEAIDELPEDQAVFVREKLEGKTLEEIGTEAGITRERVRQIIARAMKWIKSGHKGIKAHRWLAEDKYKYLYENYDIGRSFWREINLPEYIYNYLQMEYKHGNKPVSDILEDDKVDDKIKRLVQVKQDENYIIVGDRRILRSRSAIEDYIISIYFRDEGSFEQFIEKYNEFLHENELDNDPKLKISDDVIRTRVNKLALSHNVLWKQNQRLRYYDIDGTEFTTLLDTLCLEQYHNTELSTLKFMRDYPELMDEYDIRDEYELHNLLKKICNPENYHDIVFERMPGIRFGEFDRDCAVKEIMADMSPVTREDLAEAISQEYGFKAETINANWLNCLDAYYYNGIYTMPTNSETTLSKELLSDLKGCLSEQFYFTDDLPVIIKKTLGLKHYKPSAYELKRCGFKVYSGYILKDCTSSSEYFLNMFTSTDLVDLSGIDPRLYSVGMFSNMLCSLKEDYEIMEYAPYKFINISRLQLMGIDKDDLRAYCRDVKKYVGIENFFTVFWLKKVGFHNKLDDLGFEDYFYENILSVDSEIYAFLQHTIEDNNSQVLYYGEERLGKKDFVRSIIRKENAIDKEDLINYCKEQYNTRIDDKQLYPIMNDSEIYYDKTMERFYSNYSVFIDEL